MVPSSLPLAGTVTRVRASGDVGAVAAHLAEAADAALAALAVTPDWGEAGTRPGQHHSDLAADEAARSVLDAAGWTGPFVPTWR